mgnify:CR=1 FL=1
MTFEIQTPSQIMKRALTSRSIETGAISLVIVSEEKRKVTKPIDKIDRRTYMTFF